MTSGGSPASPKVAVTPATVGGSFTVVTRFIGQDLSSPPYEVVVSYRGWVTGVAPPD